MAHRHGAAAARGTNLLTSAFSPQVLVATHPLLDLRGVYSVPVRCQGGIHQALVDMGCTQTLVHQTLIRTRELLEAEWVELSCVHGDIHEHPIVQLQIKYKGKTHRVKAGVNPQLTHPLILGTDCPGYNNLQRLCCANW